MDDRWLNELDIKIKKYLKSLLSVKSLQKTGKRCVKAFLHNKKGHAVLCSLCKKSVW